MYKFPFIRWRRASYWPSTIHEALTRVSRGLAGARSTVRRGRKMLLGAAKSLGFWVGISVVGVISLGVFLSIKHWDWLQGGTEYIGNAATVRNIALVVGGIVAILTALWRSLVAEKQATASKQQSQIAERVYLNERYRQAASMLGDNEIPVRLAGIFALERLAEDHPDEFRLEAIKLLVEFVRTPPDLKHPQPKVWDGWMQLKRPATRKDVQAAMTAIAEMRRVDAIQNKRDPAWLDLHDAQLCGVELNMPLRRVNLQNANLMFAHLERRDLTGAQLQWANCRQALFEDADLSGAEMSDADFSGVRARKCKFRGATMPAKMIDADLEEADLAEAIFPNTDLTGATLRGANLTGAELRGRVYWIDRAGRHEAEENAVRITQGQLDEAVADLGRPPKLSVHPVGDAETPMRLVWRGKASSGGLRGSLGRCVPRERGA